MFKEILFYNLDVYVEEVLIFKYIFRYMYMYKYIVVYF